MTDSWPRPLADARGPFRADKLEGASAGMGDFGPAARALATEGLVPPDMMTGLTLFLLASQPRDPAKKQTIPGGGGGVAGGVWVRERFTIHRPLAKDEVFLVQGASMGRHVHKGRRYGTTSSHTLNAAGEPAATNLTTGLLAYRVEPGLEDQVEGLHPDDIDPPGPDWGVAGNNPCRDTLAAVREGETFDGEAVLVSLAMMEARDTRNPENPIHSDPELARKAGLARPIAGGSHVQAFALDVLMRHLGTHVLFHGAHLDTRWKAPVYADTVILPRARVAETREDRVVFHIEATLEDGATAMVGAVTVPLA